MNDLVKSDDYRQWIVSVKERVQASQIKAAVAVNYAMLELYRFLGEQIIERQETASWGDGFLKQMAKDLSTDFPEMKGFSHRNLKYMRQWVTFWNDTPQIRQQAVAQITDPKVQTACCPIAIGGGTTCVANPVGP